MRKTRKRNPLLMTVGNPPLKYRRSATKLTAPAQERMEKMFGLMDPHFRKRMIEMEKESREKYAGTRKKVLAHRGKVSRNPLLMTVGNPGYKEYFDVTYPSGVKSKVLPGGLRQLIKEQGIPLPKGIFSARDLLRKYGFKVEGHRDVWFDNPCGSKKNPLYAKVGKYGAKATRKHKVSLKSRIPYKVSEAVRKFGGITKTKGLRASITPTGWRVSKYTPNEAGIKPLVASSRTVTMPFEKGAELIYRKETPSRIRCFEAQVKAYQDAHRGNLEVGPLPATLTFKKIKIGSENITDRTYTISMGTIPESTYTVSSRSGKAKQSRHWRHEWKTKRLHQEVFPGGKVIMNDGGGMKLVKQGWMDA